jgi:hypothetical protein
MRQPAAAMSDSIAEKPITQGLLALWDGPRSTRSRKDPATLSSHSPHRHGGQSISPSRLEARRVRSSGSETIRTTCPQRAGWSFEADRTARPLPVQCLRGDLHAHTEPHPLHAWIAGRPMVKTGRCPYGFCPLPCPLTIDTHCSVVLARPSIVCPLRCPCA